MMQTRKMTTELPEIVKRAMVETVVDTGQLSKSEVYQLNKYVKRGWLSKGKGGPYPKLKTVYAVPTYDFEANRQAWIDHLMAIAAMDKARRGNCCACGKNH